ncbi:MAG: immunity 52 family protein [Tannerella sp.]|jgi:hypothetical protein|nr:immunity 52 family protein [Tannerella sp.]
MEQIDFLIRFPNKEMTAREYIGFCKIILKSLLNASSDFTTVGIWSQVKKANYNFDMNLTNFEETILKEMQIESEEYAFINENESEKNLMPDSRSYGNFAFSFAFSFNGDESREMGVSIWAGDSGNKETGILNFTFPEKTESSITLKKILPLLKINIDLVNPYYATISSFEFRKKANQKDDKFKIGWINYFSDKQTASLLPKDVSKEVLPNGGVIFWLSEERTVSTNETLVAKATEIRNILAKKGLLKYSQVKPMT